MAHQEITEHMLGLADRELARNSMRYFKTAKGEYGHGDTFLGIRVPVIRQSAKRFQNASLDTTESLLKSGYHEIRLLALLLLVSRYAKGNADDQDRIFRFYLSNTRYINNWDLVDSSAPYIIGAYLDDRDKSILYELAGSESLWERRIAVMATFYFIRNHRYDDALRIAERLLEDREDLIHKAVGWMLREVGKRDLAAETAFLKAHYRIMPRTMLRYAIEKFNEADRQKFLKGKI